MAAKKYSMVQICREMRLLGGQKIKRFESWQDLSSNTHNLGVRSEGNNCPFRSWIGVRGYLQLMCHKLLLKNGLCCEAAKKVFLAK